MIALILKNGWTSMAMALLSKETKSRWGTSRKDQHCQANWGPRCNKIQDFLARMAAWEAAIELQSCIQYGNVWGWDPGNCISGQWKILQQANAASFADLKPDFCRRNLLLNS